MTRRLISRVARMDAAELAWRLVTLFRRTRDHLAYRVKPPRWNRRHLARRLAPMPALASTRAALRSRRWDAAHRSLSRHFATRAKRFVIQPRDRSELGARISNRFPQAPADAIDRADSILEGRYDLLGYRGLRFDTTSLKSPASVDDLSIDWHVDPVQGRRAPATFWSRVPYLDPACGDHKIIWELNRHQHWLVLGRAYWLTGETRYRDRCLGELKSWLGANPPLTGINWSSMLELALRSLSWIWCLHFCVDPDAADAEPWTVDLLLALDRQLAHVEQNVSYYFSPNTHLLGEALALYVAGRTLPELAASERRASIGRRILIAEATRQIGADGGHCERSTHYHRYTLDFYLLALVVARITGDPIAAALERTVARLAAAARLLADDTGRAPHIGDDDGGMLLPIAGRSADDWRDSLRLAAEMTNDASLAVSGPTEEELWMLGDAPAVAPAGVAQSSGALTDTGYYVSRSAAGLHVVVDGGPHGFRNAGHAHADALALTASFRGQPFLIDTGTGCYTIDLPTRDRFRATAAHNTVVVNGRSQSSPSGPFHWATAADATTHRWRTVAGFDYFDGSHDGYAPIRHRRRVFVLHGDLLVVADHLSGPADASADVHWHVDPHWDVSVGGNSATFSNRDDRVALLVPDGRMTCSEAEDDGLGWHSPEYGRIERASTIRLSHQGATPFWMASIFDFNASSPASGVTWLPVWAEAGVMAHGAALRIARERVTDYVLVAEPVDERAGRTWRVGEFETDARLLFCRVAHGGALLSVALVDGSLVRSTGRRPFGLTLGRRVPARFIDETTMRTFTPCAASPAL